MTTITEVRISELQRKFDAKLREVKSLKESISAMRQKAYFDRKYTTPKDYHNTVIAHGNAVNELEKLQREVNKSKMTIKAANEPFNIRFIRSARQILDEKTFENIVAAADLLAHRQ